MIPKLYLPADWTIRLPLSVAGRSDTAVGLLVSHLNLTQPREMKPRDIAAYAFLAVTWGLSFLVLLKVVHAFGWVGAVTLRSLIAGITLFLLAAATRRRLDFSAGWRHFATVGATTVAAQLIGLSYATPRIGTAMAAILVAAIPLFSMILGQLWGLERITVRGLAGLLLGAAGIVVLVGFPSVPITPSFVFGCAASLFSSFSAAFGSNYANRHLRSAGSFELTGAAFLFGGLMTLPLLLVVPVPAHAASCRFPLSRPSRLRDERADLCRLFPAGGQHWRNQDDQCRIRRDHDRGAGWHCHAWRVAGHHPGFRRGGDHRRLHTGAGSVPAPGESGGLAIRPAFGVIASHTRTS